MNRETSGALLILSFVFFSAVRDVYFSGVFRDFDFFTVVFISFFCTSLFFFALSLLRHRSELAIAAAKFRVVWWMNVTTAIAWILYFFAIKCIEPSVVNTLWAGAAPVILGVLSWLGFTISKPEPIRGLERGLHLGILASLVFLAWVTLSGLSGVEDVDFGLAVLGLAAIFLSSTSIVISVLISKHLHEIGVGAEAVVGLRFVLLAVVAGVVVVFGSKGPDGGAFAAAIGLIPAAAGLLILPIYLFQKGMVHTTPITAETIGTLGPILIFLLQLTDTEIGFSFYSLGGIVAYTVFSVSAVVFRGFVVHQREASPT
ncbi:MAG: hypothetical protein MJE77_48045 [Proteobacteria bacterium]|nr:hypothetical protein [Pseudomonadota bacterium]